MRLTKNPLIPRWKPDPFGHTLQEVWADLEVLTI